MRKKLTILLCGALGLTLVAGCKTGPSERQAKAASVRSLSPDGEPAPDKNAKALSDDELIAFGAPVELSLGDSKVLYIDDQYSTERRNGTVLCNGCSRVRKNSIIRNLIKPKDEGFLWLDTLDTESSADTVVRIYRTPTVTACNDDISRSDQRSEISNFKVRTGTRYRYIVQAGIKANTPDRPIKMRVSLKREGKPYDRCP